MYVVFFVPYQLELLLFLFICDCQVFLVSELVEWEGMGGIGEFTAPPLCELTQMTLMQVVITGTDLNRWEPLSCTLLGERAVIWFT